MGDREASMSIAISVGTASYGEYIDFVFGLVERPWGNINEGSIESGGLAVAAVDFVEDKAIYGHMGLQIAVKWEKGLPIS
jgi:hypothetical protein